MVRFPIHTGPTSSLTPQLDRVGRVYPQIFSIFNFVIGVGERELQENFEKDELFEKGTEK